MNSQQRNALAHAVRKIVKEEFGISPINAGATSSVDMPRGSSRPPEITREPPRPPDPTSESKTRVAVRALKWIWKKATSKYIPALITLLGLGATLTAFYPKFQFSLQPPLDPANVLSSNFLVQYDGPIPISNVEFHCVWEDVKAKANNSNWVFQGLDMHEKMRPPLPMMYWGDTESVGCTGFKITSTDYAAIELWIDYSPFKVPFWRFSRVARYQTDIQSDGTRRLIPVASGQGWGKPKDRAPLLFNDLKPWPPIDPTKAGTQK